MKKLLLTLLLAVSAPAMADKFVVERAWTNDLNSTNGADTWYLKGIIDINKDLAVDSSLQVTQVEGSNKVSNRFDVGVIPKFDVYGPVRGRVRLALGEKWSSTGNYKTYAVEPGIYGNLGAGFSASLGYRYRNSLDSTYKDRTTTLRTGVDYAITPKDSVGVRLDNMRGDSKQDIWNLNYVRSF
jgi:hypothetical protein